jgi:hypothetical protein
MDLIEGLRGAQWWHLQDTPSERKNPHVESLLNKLSAKSIDINLLGISDGTPDVKVYGGDNEGGGGPAGQLEGIEDMVSTSLPPASIWSCRNQAW